VNILVTGSKGFIGKKLLVSLNRRNNLDIIECDFDTKFEELKEHIIKADVIIHLAGVNRPQNVDDFQKVNSDLSRRICDVLREYKRKPIVIFPSSIQAILDNPYGISKRLSEEEFFSLNHKEGVPVAVFRLPGVFGKWCRPN